MSTKLVRLEEYVKHLCRMATFIDGNQGFAVPIWLMDDAIEYIKELENKLPKWIKIEVDGVLPKRSDADKEKNVWVLYNGNIYKKHYKDILGYDYWCPSNFEYIPSPQKV